MGKMDRRASWRHQLALDVTLHVGGGGLSVRGKSIDLSRSGIFVVVGEHIPEGRRVDVVIGWSRLSTPIAASGMVVHTIPGVGVGIRFSPQSPRTRAQIGDLIAQLKKSA